MKDVQAEDCVEPRGAKVMTFKIAMDVFGGNTGRLRQGAGLFQAFQIGFNAGCGGRTALHRLDAEVTKETADIEIALARRGVIKNRPQKIGTVMAGSLLALDLE